MDYLFHAPVVEELERIVSSLESLGSILTSLSHPDHELPHPSCIADLGRLISKEAMEALSLLAERVVSNPPQACQVGEGPHAWFVPEAYHDARYDPTLATA